MIRTAFRWTVKLVLTAAICTIVVFGTIALLISGFANIIS